jgi:hypothetical protein
MATMRVFALAVSLVALISKSLEISRKQNVHSTYEILLVRQVHTW